MSFPGSVLLANGEHLRTSSTKQHPLGTRGYTKDGRAFRYAKAGGTALAAGMLIQSEASHADDVAEPLADSTDWTVPSTSTTLIHLSTATSMATADAFADGYFMVTAGATTGETGVSLQIESCPKTTATAGPAYCPEIFLIEGDYLPTALTTADTISLIKNPYDDVIVTLDAAPTAPAVGVCPCPVTENCYFWLQTWGMCCCRVSDTWDTGHTVLYASATGTRTGEGTQPTCLECDIGAAVVGIAQYIGTDGYNGAMIVTLAP